MIGRLLFMLIMAALLVIALYPARVGLARLTEATPTGTSSACAPAPAPAASATPIPADSATPSTAPSSSTPTAAIDAALITAINAIVDCVEARQYDELVNLVTPHFLRTAIGLDEDEWDQAAEALAFPPLAVQSLGNVQRHDAGRYSIDIVYRREAGQHMLLRERWFFVEQDGRLLFDAIASLPIRPGGPTFDVEVRLDDDAITLSQQRLSAEHDFVFHVANAGDRPHEFAVFLPPPGVSTEAFVDGQDQGVEFIGAVLVPPGQTGELVLVDLDPGTYLVASFLEGPDGNTDAENGLITQFTIGSS